MPQACLQALLQKSPKNRPKICLKLCLKTLPQNFASSSASKLCLKLCLKLALKLCLKKVYKIHQNFGPKSLGIFDVKTLVFGIKTIFFEEKSPKIFGPKFWLIFWTFLRARPFGARWVGPPPFCRAEILKKSSGKNVLETILYFLGKNLPKTTDLVERIRMQFFCPKLIGER